MATTSKTLNWTTERGSKIMVKMKITNQPSGENAADEWSYEVERLTVNEEAKQGYWNQLKKTIDFKSRGQTLHIQIPADMYADLISKETEYFASRRSNFKNR